MGVRGIYTFLRDHAELSGAIEFDVHLADLADRHYDAHGGSEGRERVLVIDAWNFLHSIARKNLRPNPFYGGQPGEIESMLKGCQEKANL